MLELRISCHNSIKVIDPKSALSTVFGSKYATFYINNKEKISILFRMGGGFIPEYWKLIIKNTGLGGSHHLDVGLWPGEFVPTFKWGFWGHPPRGLIIKSRHSFFGL